MSRHRHNRRVRRQHVAPAPNTFTVGVCGFCGGFKTVATSSGIACCPICPTEG
jgi:hypothetical protein